MHSLIEKTKVRIIKGSEIPPNPGLDDVFEALVEKKHKTKWIKKLTNNGYSTFFPKNWDKQRILEEIAFAFKNKELIKGSSVIFEGISTNGIKINFIIKNSKIITAYPIL